VDLALHHKAWLVFGTAATVAAAQKKGQGVAVRRSVNVHPLGPETNANSMSLTVAVRAATMPRRSP
jgi:hypothetical protein